MRGPSALLLLQLLQGARAACFPDAIPADKLQNITVNGEVMPLGIWQLDWASARLTTEILRILLTERLGINTVVSGVGSSSITGYFAVSACEDPLNAYANLEQKCGKVANPHHIVMEMWAATSAAFTGAQARISDLYPDTAAVLIGNMGYYGHQGIFVPGPALQLGRSQGQLPLRYYESYNASWHDVSPFFANLSSIPSDGLLPCSKLRGANSSLLLSYIQSTGDAAGVIQLSPGLVSPRCYFPDRWWLSPPCRQAPQSCIPLITGGNGFFLGQMMQLVTLNNMAVGIATAASSSLYDSLPRIGRGSLFYWFWPDTVFADFNPQTLVFPDTSQYEWTQNIYRTTPAPSELQKLIAPALRTAAGSALQVTQRMQISSQDMQGLITQYKAANKSYTDVACDWLLSNGNRWKAWIPQPTECGAGFGLVDSLGAFQSSVATAVACAQCSPGRFAAAPTCKQCPAGTFSSTSGATVCTLCKPGHFTSLSKQTGCTACAPGTFSELPGASQCETCAEGYYAESSGETSCVRCAIQMPWLFESIFYPEGRSPRSCGSPGLGIAQLLVWISTVVFLFDRLQRALLHRVAIVDITTDRGRVLVHCHVGHGFCTKLLRWVEVEVWGTEIPQLDGRIFRLVFLDKARGELLQSDGKPLSLPVPLESSLGYLRLARGILGLFVVEEIPIIFQLCLCVWPPNVLLALIDLRSSIGSLGFLLGLVPAAVLYLALVLWKRWMLPTQLPFLELQKAYRQELVLRRGSFPETERGEKRGISFNQISHFYRTFEGYILQRNMYYICSNLILPLTTPEQLSFADLVGPGEANWFVSHYWGMEFQYFVESLKHHGLSEKQVLDAGNMRYWICTFSINQWKLQEEVVDAWEDTSFYRALKSSNTSGTLLVLDEKAEPLKRSWCLFEVFQTFRRRHQERNETDCWEGLQLGTATGVLNCGNASLDICLGVGQACLDLEVKSAQASNPRDKEMIDELVEKLEWEGFKGHAAVERFVQESMLDALKAGHLKHEAAFQELTDLLEKKVKASNAGEQRLSEPSEIDPTEGAPDQTEAEGTNGGQLFLELRTSSSPRHWSLSSSRFGMRGGACGVGREGTIGI